MALHNCGKFSGSDFAEAEEQHLVTRSIDLAVDGAGA